MPIQHKENVISIIFSTNISQVFAVDRSGRSSLRNCKYTILVQQILSCSVTNPRVITIRTSWILAKLWHNCVYSTALTNRLKTYDYANVCKQCKQSSDNRLPSACVQSSDWGCVIRADIDRPSHPTNDQRSESCARTGIELVMMIRF